MTDGVLATSEAGGAAPDPRVAPLTAALARRLRGVCREWEDREFAGLIERIARTKLSWEDRGYAE